MAYRVEELAARADVSVDTIRYYQTKDLLPPPTRAGRVAWYDDGHLERLARIRRWQASGLTLAVIHRLLAGELDRADEELVTALAVESRSGTPADANEAWLTLDELAARTGIPVELLVAVEREGMLVPRRVGGQARYSDADVAVAAAGLRLLARGVPLPELLDLARRHDASVRAVAHRAVELFDQHVRHPLRAAGLPEEDAAAALVAAFEDLLPATLTIVAHHFRRTLLAVAQEHIERVGTDGERRMVAVRAQQRLEEASWAG